MVQEILTYIFVGYAFFYALRGAWLLIKQSQGSSVCSSGGGCGCNAKTTLINDIKAGKKPFLIFDRAGVKPLTRNKR